MDRAARDALYAEFAAVGKALSSPKRLELIDLLAQGPAVSTTSPGPPTYGSAPAPHTCSQCASPAWWRIDDHSRFCVAFGLVERATSCPVCSVFAVALQAYGVPEEVLTDDGKVFTGRYASRPVEVLFDRICRENGIRHLLTGPRSPTTIDKIERFHGTARRELLNAAVFDSKANAQQVIAAWVDEYNTDRPRCRGSNAALPCASTDQQGIERTRGTAPGSVDSLPVRIRPRWKDVRHGQGVSYRVPS